MALQDYASMAASSGIALNDPDVQAAIKNIESEVQAEGLGVSDATARVKTFFDAASNLYQKASGSIDMAGSVQAAAKFVHLNHSEQGAMDTASGLLQAAQNAASGHESPPEAVAEFSGPLIAAMVGAGAVSAGLGAAIVGFIALGAKMLEDANVFPNRPGFQVCPGFTLTTPHPPTYAINCLAVFDDAGAIAPGSAYWRSFPNPKNPADNWWFQPVSKDNPFIDWPSHSPARWIGQAVALSAAPVDIAFPTYWMAHFMYDQKGDDGAPVFNENYLVQQGILHGPPTPEQRQALIDFTAGFFQAWKANAEYWLNGHHGAEDWQVLVRFAQVWNRAHAPGQGLDVGVAQVFNMPAGPPISYAPFWMSLVTQITRANPPGIVSADGYRLHLNTGPLKTAAWRAANAKSRAAAAGRAGWAARHATPPSKLAGAVKVAPPKPVPKPTVPLHLGGLGHVNVPPPPKPHNKYLPLVPAVVGAVAATMFGPIALVGGIAASAFWLFEEHRKK